MDRAQNIRRLTDILDDDKMKTVLGFFRASSLDQLTDEQLLFTIRRRVPEERLLREQTLLSLVAPDRIGALCGYYGVSGLWNLSDSQLDDAIAKKSFSCRTFREMFPGLPDLTDPIGPLSVDGKLDAGNLERLYRFVRYMSWERKKALDSGWDRAYIDRNMPAVTFPRELVRAVTGNIGGILDRWGLDEDKKKGLSKWARVSGSDELISEHSESLGRTFFWAFRDLEWSKPVPDEFVWDFRTPEEKAMDAFVDINRDRLVAKREGHPLPHFPEKLCRKLCDPAFLDLAGVPEASRSKIKALRSYGNDAADVCIAITFKDTAFAKSRIEAKAAKAIPRNFVTSGSTLREILKELRAENAEMVMYHKGKRLVRPEFSDYLAKTCTDDIFLKKAGIDLGPYENLDNETLSKMSQEGPDAELASIARWKRRIAFLESKGPLEEQFRQMDEKSKRSLAFFFTRGIQPVLVRRIREEKLTKLGVDLEALARYYKADSCSDLTLEQLDDAYEKKCRKLGIAVPLRYSAGNMPYGRSGGGRSL